MTSQQGPMQGHSRHVSESRRVPLARRSTRGPLDMDPDEPSENKPPTPALQTALPPSPAVGPSSTSILSPTASSLLSPTTRQQPGIRTRSPSPSPRLPLDLSPLLRPSLYGSIPTMGVAQPFLDPSVQPTAETTLPTLLAQHRFRHAAHLAAGTLTSGAHPPTSTSEIFSLYHTRLSCLVLCSHPDIAAKEAKPLTDILARESSAYTRPERDVFLNQVPWSLRLLLLRLQTHTTGDLRRGIMGLYALGSECRALSLKAQNENDTEASRLWRSRLADLGVRVASELVNMGEFETAKRHLNTLSVDLVGEAEKVEMKGRQCLLCLRIGDIEAAKGHLAELSTKGTVEMEILPALISLASSDFSTALSQLQVLKEKYPENALVTHNLAIAHFYMGDIATAAGILEELVGKKETVFPGLLFNMAVLYELRTEKAVERKTGLVMTVRDMGIGEMQTGGWERRVGEFKLS